LRQAAAASKAEMPAFEAIWPPSSFGLKRMVAKANKGYIRNMVQTSRVDSGPVPNADNADELGVTASQKAVLLKSIAEGEAQFQAGAAIPGADVLAWIRSWGTAKPLPVPRRGNERL
jgi:hypothetical protein